MPNILDATGLTIKTLDEIQTEIQQALKDGISQSLDVEEESELGQIIGAFSGQLRETLELFQAGFSAQDPAQGSGFGLAQSTAVIGTIRRGATFSTDTLNLDLDAGSYSADQLIVHVAGSPDSRFANVAAVTSTGGSTSVLMAAERAGPVRAPAGTLTVIAETVSGFNAVLSDPADAVLGALPESDSALRLRRVEELYLKGSTNTSAVEADIRQVSGVTSANVLENDTMVTVGGIPAKSIHAIVLGGTDADIRAAIFASKAGGIRAYGTTTGTFTDSQGNVHQIDFSRPTLVPITIVCNFNYLAGSYVDAATAETEMVNRLLEVFATNQTVGKDVLFNRYISAGMGLFGVVDLTTLTLNGVSGNVVIGAAALATLDVGDITVTATEVASAP